MRQKIYWIYIESHTNLGQFHMWSKGMWGDACGDATSGPSVLRGGKFLALYVYSPSVPSQAGNQNQHQVPVEISWHRSFHCYRSVTTDPSIESGENVRASVLWEPAEHPGCWSWSRDGRRTRGAQGLHHWPFRVRARYPPHFRCVRLVGRDYRILDPLLFRRFFGWLETSLYLTLLVDFHFVCLKLRAGYEAPNLRYDYCS